MKVFVTGASGFVGSAVVQELIGAGHEVIGLARSETSAKALVAAGAKVFRGDVTDHDSLRRGAGQADGVIHTAFNHDFSKFKENCEADRLAIEVLGNELAGSKRPLIITSGIGLMKPGQIAKEEESPVSGSSASPRIASEQAAEKVAGQGVHVSIVRLPPSVHGDGDHGFVPLLIGIAARKKTSAYIGEGLNHWPTVHRLDAAQLYRLALEKNANRACYHAVAEEGVPFREIATAIGRGLNVPVKSVSTTDASTHFEWFTHFAMIDVPASSESTKAQLGWKFTQPGLIEDLDTGTYFAKNSYSPAIDLSVK